MSAYVPLYIKKNKASRGLRKPGEIFAIEWKKVGFVFGRVVRNDCCVFGARKIGKSSFVISDEREKGLYLVYIYSNTSEHRDEVPVLSPDKLLIAPEKVAASCWTHGYFVPVAFRDLERGDLLSSHCFKTGWPIKSGIAYVNEYNVPIKKRTDWCVHDGIHSYGSIEREIARALGLPYPD